MKREKIDYKTLLSGIISAILFAVLVAALLWGVRFFSGKASQKGADTLRDGIRRASVQCYAIEGRYPPSIEYLESNYGIQINRDCYYVFYNGFAANVMPEITVVLAAANE